jgi:hypothetical protein
MTDRQREFLDACMRGAGVGAELRAAAMQALAIDSLAQAIRALPAAIASAVADAAAAETRAGRR